MLPMNNQLSVNANIILNIFFLKLKIIQFGGGSVYYGIQMPTFYP